MLYSKQKIQLITGQFGRKWTYWHSRWTNWHNPGTLKRENGCGIEIAPIWVKRNYAKYANNVHYANYVKRYV